MKIEFSDLDSMLDELKEKEVTELRVEALFDKKYIEDGLCVYDYKFYVVIQALLSDALYAEYQEVTYKGVPVTDQEMEKIRKENLKEKEKISKKLEKEGFTVRGGHFRE